MSILYENYYETIGQSSYFVVSFAGGQGIINYQLQMLTNNEIINILKANKRQKNEDIIVSYNITSKVALSQIDGRNKITKQGLINIIEGAIAALNDIAEYQLVSSGIVFDEEYIFVNPGTYEPSFIYLPCTVEDSGIEPLKKFLLSLIIGSKVELTNDNFVQVLLETLNSDTLTFDDLRNICSEYKNAASNDDGVMLHNNNVASKPVQVTAPPPVEVLQNNVQNVVPPQVKPQVTEQQPHVISAQKQIPVQEPQKPNKVKEEKVKKENNPKKGVFMIIQLAFVGVIIGLTLTGFLNTPGGGINLTYLLGVLMCIGCADFVIYREMFVNNKNQDKKEKGSKPGKAPVQKKASIAMPGKDIPVPKAQPVNDVPVQQNYEEKTATENEVLEVPVAVPPVVPQPAYIPPQPVVQMPDAVQVFESDDTVVLGEESTCAHLELCENGMVTKVNLDKEVTIVGKLSSQCDFAINSNKISKIHAEFIVRGNEYFVKDCNSTNGTYINGGTQRITSNVEYQIYDGYRISLANVDLTLRC